MFEMREKHSKRFPTNEISVFYEHKSTLKAKMRTFVESIKYITLGKLLVVYITLSAWNKNCTMLRNTSGTGLAKKNCNYDYN